MLSIRGKGAESKFPDVFVCCRAPYILPDQGLNCVEVLSLTLLPICSGPARLAGGCKPLEASHPHHGQVVPRGQC